MVLMFDVVGTAHVWVAASELDRDQTTKALQNLLE